MRPEISKYKRTSDEGNGLAMIDRPEQLTIPKCRPYPVE
jgi:hypothetical protein